MVRKTKAPSVADSEDGDRLIGISWAMCFGCYVSFPENSKRQAGHTTQQWGNKHTIPNFLLFCVCVRVCVMSCLYREGLGIWLLA